ncbi:DUF418 domain-containing protein [Jiulongibacter sediminis]|uniref:DUF418 domain-containing protein n=1 Tax=Jiulongibacter sediminis TaxID=1605367 RepID=A0A0P7C0A5_9BACT|nr:DUF418 domain-containing protein [Jiulongibacter sediminis]KPM47399.1 hypothetical protein AFM12_14695 [Jiulongibacter sediminis]TBX22979.1 hypothetical protein TK44_14705 [Jiulongibacter sediminis]
MSQETTLKPILLGERINSLDVVRGIALLGILLMNINGMGLPMAYEDPTVSGGDDGLNLGVWVVNNMLFEGTMRGLFTLLFGASVILLTSRLEAKGAGITTADIYYRRTLWLLLFGIINVYVFLWSGDILYPYALLGLTLFPFRNARVKTLFICAGLLLIFGTLWNIRDYHNAKEIRQAGIEMQALKDAGKTLAEKEEAKIEAWNKQKTKHTPEEIAENVEGRLQSNYFDVMMAKVEDNQFMQTWFMYRMWPWDILSFMLIGMAFFKLRIFHAEKSNKFYLLTMLAGYLVGLTVNYYETRMVVDSQFDVVTMAKANQTYDLGRLFTTLGHVGLIMLFVKSGILSFLQKSLAAVGKTTLSNYLLTAIGTSILFYGFGFSLYNQLERFELYYVVAGFWIFQLIASPIWLKYFKYGPFEWLWRSLTYQKWQELKIKK